MMTSKDEQSDLGRLLLKTGFEVLCIKDVHICERANEHGTMRVRFLTGDDVGPEDILRQQESAVSLHSREGENIFFGVCREIRLISQNAYAEIEIVASTLSIELDKEKRTYAFQDESKTLKKVMEQGIGKKATVKIDPELGSGALREMLSQKDETDWEFDRRIADQHKMQLFVNSKSAGCYIHIGNVPFQIVDPGVVLDWRVERDVDKVRKLQGNSIPRAAVFKYENTVLTVSDLTIGVGYGIRWDNRVQTVVKSTITCRRGLLQNEIVLANEDGLSPDDSLITGARGICRVLEGTVLAVEGNTVQVDLGEQDGAPRWIPYAHTAADHFYCMPDVGDKIFVYHETGEDDVHRDKVLCIGSVHENDSPDFARYQDKMLTADDRMVKFTDKTVELIGNRKKYDGGQGNRAQIVLSDEYGIEIRSSNDITFETTDGGNIVIQAVDKGFKGLDKIKQAFDRTHLIGNTRFVATGGGLPDTAAIANTKAISFGKLKKAVKDNLRSPLRLVDALQELAGQIGGSTGTDGHRSSGGRPEGAVDIFASGKLVLNVGRSSITFAKGVIHIKSGKFRQLGTDHSPFPSLGGLMDMELDMGKLAHDLTGALPAGGGAPAMDALAMIPWEPARLMTARSASQRAKAFQTGAKGSSSNMPVRTAVDSAFDLDDADCTADASRSKKGKLIAEGGTRCTRQPKKRKTDTNTGAAPAGATAVSKPNKPALTQNRENRKKNGDPIDMVTGSYLIEQCDFIINDICGIYAVERTYESLLADKDSPVGRGWTLSLFSTAYIYDDRVEIVMPDGHTEIFLKTEDGYRNRRGGTKRLGLYAQEDGYLLKEADTGLVRSYGTDGRLLQEIDRNGNRRIYEYTGSTLNRIAFASGQHLDFTWQGAHVASIQDCIGRRVSYRYEGSLLTEVEMVTGGVERYAYDGDGRVTEVTDANGIAYVHNEYDRAGRVVRQTLYNGQEYVLLYDDDDRTNTYLTPGNGRQIRYTYDRDRQLIRTQYQDGTTQERGYDVWENINWEKDRNGNETHRTYDEHGHLLKEERADGLVVSYEYTGSGDCLRMWDSGGREVCYAYDARGNLTGETERMDASMIRSVSIGYDRHGRVESFTDANGHRETYSHDSRFWESTAFTTASGDTYRHRLDSAGRCVAITDADGESTYAYNSFDILAMATDPLGNTTRYLYDRVCDLVGLVRPNHHAPGTAGELMERYVNDAFHRRLSRTDCTGAVWAVHRDGEGNIIKEISPNAYDSATGDGAGISYSYDDYDNNTMVHYPDGGVLRRWYDPAGNMVRAVSPSQYDSATDSGAGYSYEYDSMGRIVQETASDGTVLRRYVYDLHGNVVKVITARGMATGGTDEERVGSLYTYNLLGWLMESRIPVSMRDDGEVLYRLEKYRYDKAGNRIQERRFCDYQTKDSEGGTVHTIDYAYDAADRLIRVSDCTGAALEYRYDSKGRRIFEKRRVSDTVDQILRYSYDAGGRMVELSRTADREGCGRSSVSVRYEYDRNGNTIRTILPTGVQVIREYDAADRLVMERHVDRACGIDSTTRFAYDKAGDLMRITDAQGRSTQIGYDLMGREIARTERDGSVTRQYYDPDGRLTRVVRPNEHARTYGDAYGDGRGLQYTYDAQGNVLTVIRPDGSIQESNVYDAEGSLIHTQDGMGNGADMEYDLGGRRIRVATRGKASQQYEYDAFGNITGVTDGVGNRTRYILDKWGRIVEVRRADGSCELYGYDYAGDIIRSTDGEGNTTTYEYGSNGQLMAMTDPEGEQETYHYDAQDRLCQRTDRNGTVTRYAYNMYGNLTERRAKKADGTELADSYGYTPEGLLASAVSQGMRYSYAYDAMGRLTEKKASGRTLLSLQYDLNGNLTRQTDVTGKVTEFRYDLMDNIREVWDDGTKIAEYEYNANDTVKSMRNGSLYTEYTYDADRNLTGMKTLLGTDTIVDNRYTYDGNGDRLEKIQRHQTTRYGYDSMRRLTRVEYPDVTEGLFYDRAGNRTKRLYDGVEELYQYDRRNRLITYTKGGVSTHYEYDDAGNLLKDDRARYAYDAFGRSAKVETFNGNIQINHYDAEGLRHEMEENGKLVSFIFRGDEVVAEESQEDRIRYIRTDVLLASDAESARTYYHYASDEMGSITHVVDGGDEGILDRYEYDAWGNLTACEEKVHNRFKFNGQQYDPVSQQYYLRARYYDPVIGRFTQEDTYRGDGLNLYAYCRDNPVYYVDPSGHICETAAQRIMDKFVPDGSCNASRNEQKKLASYLRNKKNHGETLTPNEARILNQINNYTAESRYGLRMGPYDKTKRPSGTQLHHVSQDAVFGTVIPKGEGLTVALHGDAIFGIGSQHYKAHSRLEAFWSDYRRGGIYDGGRPTVGQYNRALYDSMINAGLSDKQAAYVVSRAYEQQKDYGLSNSSQVPRVPNPTHQQK